MSLVSEGGRARRVLFTWVLAIGWLLSACGRDEQALAPKTQTWAELRTVRRGVTVTPPGGDEREPHARERLVDGTRVKLAPGGLAWIRRDGGATLLVRGPAELGLFAKSVALEAGRAFVDSPGPMELTTPAGALHLSRVRSSIEVGADGAASAYVLAGEVRSDGGARASEGERLSLPKGAAGSVTPELSWDDWTGGLATTDRVAEPAPFGVGTVGGRDPGSLGEARFPLAIQRLDVRVTIDGDFAVTEVDQRFFNSSSKTVEGIYRFRSPEAASLARFGVDRGGGLVWGRVKERAAASAQYQQNVYAGSIEDPALLEWEAPGAYKARLYPIGAGETRRVVVRYSEWLGRTGKNAERRSYVYPMAAEGSEESLPHIEELTITLDLAKARADEVRVGMAGTRSGQQIVVRAQDFVPRADLTVELFDSGTETLTAYRSAHRPDLEVLQPDDRDEARKLALTEQDYVLVPVRARDVVEPQGGLDLAIVVDSSAANEPAAMALARAATGALLAHLGEQDRALVWSGAEELRPVVPELSSLTRIDASARRRVLAGLATLSPGGATDLGAMLTRAAASLDPNRRGAVVYVGDGLATVGELSLDELEKRLKKLARPVRLFALGVGARVDMGLLAGLARGGFAERVDSGHSAARSVLRLLELAERPAVLGTAVNLGTGVERVYPRDSDTLVADETVIVVGRVRSGASVPEELVLGGGEAKQTVALRSVDLADDGDLRRRWAGRRLDELLTSGAGRAAMVDLGSRYGIITPVTSLYVPTAREIEEEQRARREEVEPESEAAETEDNKEGGTGTRAKGEEGSMGKSTNQRYAVSGPRQQALTDAAEFGMIGLLNSGAGGEPAPADAPAAPSPSDKSRGNTWGAEIGDAYGAGGLGLKGVGEGGGGKGDGIGLGSIGTLGHGAGTGTGQGFGSGHGRLGGAHAKAAPRVRMGATTVTGKLPPEVVQRIVRQNFGRFRLCYEQGLAKNPNLAGRVSIRFVIGNDGAVQSAQNSGSDLPDSAVVECVNKAFYGLSFPEPEGGVVTVVYPILFSSDGAADKEPSATSAAPSALTVQIDGLPRRIRACSAGANVSLDERVVLWRERLARVSGDPGGVENVYRRALAQCEAPTWRERRRLLGMLLDALPKVSDRVALWRSMFADRGAADVLYRGLTARVKTPAEMRELHQALGLKSIDPGLLEKYIREAKTPEARVGRLRALSVEWPDDFALALAVLDALEDAGDRGGARSFAERLRARPEIDAHVRTAIGELHLRLAESAKSAREKQDEIAAARRAFGEIVEFAPEDPVARRRLGDLLRAHGWYADAARQYETLGELAPDDASVPLLLGAAAEGQGQLESAIRWLEKASESGPPTAASGRSPSSVARSLSATFLAWGRLAAQQGKRDREYEALRTRAERLLADDRAASSASTVRVSLVWSHPEFHPTLWSDALGSFMPAPEGDAALGVAQVRLANRAGAKLEVRLEPEDVERAARLGATATLTVVFEELGKGERVIRLPVRFARGGPPAIVFKLENGGVTRG